MGHSPMAKAVGRWSSVIILCLLWVASTRVALAGMVPVTDTPGLIAAIQSASAGDVIELAPGTYDVDQTLQCSAAGTANAPIVVRAASLGSATIRFDAMAGFRVSGPHWIFENLEIVGFCAIQSTCEIGMHLQGAADGTTIRGNRIVDFSVQIRGNGSGTPAAFPDDVLIERNEIYDTAARLTGPVAKIDAIGGRRWVVRANTVRDFEHEGGSSISYGIVLRGNSREGLVERNLVYCRRDEGPGVGAGTRLGLSLGGGGTSAALCEEASCTVEHRSGVIRSNLVGRCSDVGIYLNKAEATLVHGNTLYATAGIDVRFAASQADLRGNLLSGSIRIRDGATVTQEGNLAGFDEATFELHFATPNSADFTLTDGTGIVDQGVSLAGTDRDYCGSPRQVGTAPDLGAIEFAVAAPCLTPVAGHADLFHDGFEQGGTGRWGSRVP